MIFYNYRQPMSRPVMRVIRNMPGKKKPVDTGCKVRTCKQAPLPL